MAQRIPRGPGTEPGWTAPATDCPRGRPPAAQCVERPHATARSPPEESTILAGRDRDSGKMLAHPPRRVVHIRPLRKAASPGILVRYYRLSDIVVIDWVRFYPYDARTAVLPDAFGVE